MKNWIPAPVSRYGASFVGMTLFMLQGCVGGNKTAWEYMPDMANSPAIKSQKMVASLPHHRGMLMPPDGTVPRGYEPYPYKEDPEGAAKFLINPLPKTEEVVLAGEKAYNTYCIVCHGAKGLGDGPVVPPFPKPPSFHSEKVQNWTDGRIFHVITVGQNLMPSYAAQIEPQTRWAIIRYLRVLQLAQNPSPEDRDAYREMKEARKKKKDK